MAKRDQNLNNKKSGTLKRYFYTKTWDTSFRGNTFDIEEITHRLENNLAIDDLFDKLDKRYKRKDGNKDL